MQELNKMQVNYVNLRLLAGALELEGNAISSFRRDPIGDRRLGRRFLQCLQLRRSWPGGAANNQLGLEQELVGRRRRSVNLTH
jgi:hypothetical protein